MDLYLTHSQIPDIASLPPDLRKTAYARYIRPLLFRWPVRLAKFAFTFGFFIAMGDFEISSGFKRIALWTTGYLTADHLFDLIAITLQRCALRASIDASQRGNPA